MTKQSIRSRLLAQRRHLSAQTCLEKSLKAQGRLLQTPEFVQARTLALYSPILNEVFTEEIFAAAREAGKRTLYPRVQQQKLEFVEVQERSQLRPGAFGILEPAGPGALALREVDLLILPGVGFDLQGHRLGYGKGFYDRALHGDRPRAGLVGLAFEMQVVECLPAEAHDVRMDMIVTEDRTIDMAQGRPAAGGSL